MRIFLPIRLVKCPRFGNVLPWWGCGKAGTIIPCWEECEWPNLCRGQFGPTCQNEECAPFEPVMPLMGLYPRDICAHIYKTTSEQSLKLFFLAKKILKINANVLVQKKKKNKDAPFTEMA